MSEKNQAVKKAELEIISTLICDDVRREENGKEILIGVYAGDIIVQRFPAAMALTVWIEHSFKGKGEVGVQIRLITGHGTELFSASFTAHPTGEGQTGSFALGPVPVPMTDPGSLSVQLRQQEGDWATIKTKVVKKAPVKTATRQAR